jgi:hypothetical protein
MRYNQIHKAIMKEKKASGITNSLKLEMHYFRGCIEPGPLLLLFLKSTREAKFWRIKF